MKFFFAVFLFATSGILTAQIDQIYPGMPEAEFLAKFPNAYRDWEMQAVKIDDPNPAFTTPGNASWKLMRDTIRHYHYKSLPVYGPGAEFPKADSSKVHKMKVELEKLKAEFEKEFGAPVQYVNASLPSFPGTLKEKFCYLAVWNIKGLPVILLIARDYLMDGIPKSKRDPTPAEVYTMEVIIEGVNPFLTAKYAVGLTGKAFRLRYPALADDAVEDDMPAYAFTDSANGPEALWEFDFEDGKMWGAYYLADYGMKQGAKSTEEAYQKLKAKALQLLEEGNMKYGEPDSISNHITPTYEPHKSQLEPGRNYLYVEWLSGDTSIILVFEEANGGKSTDVYFTVEFGLLVED